MRRIYWITGKGGVGKSVASIALVKKLQMTTPNTVYISAEGTPPIKLLKAAKIKSINLTPIKSTELYLALKFHSKIVAKAIINTPFFKSIFNILPSLANLMFLGHLVHMLKEDPSLTIVVDMPASGHALTLIESTFIFERIFKSGIVFKDIGKIHKFLYQEKNLTIALITLPSLMAIEESIELQDGLRSRGIEQSIIVFNNLLSLANFKRSLLPPLLAQKIEQEEKILKSVQINSSLRIPYFTSLQEINIVQEMTAHLGDLS